MCVQQKIVTTGGFEPPPVKTSALNWRLRPLGQMVAFTPGGTRTHNLQLRRLTPYPLGHGGGKALLSARLELATSGL